MVDENRKRGKKRSNGQGSIYQRKDGIWVGAAYVLTNTGHRKRITVSAKTKTEADRKLRKKINDSDQGVPVAAESWTLGAYLEYWLANVVRHRRPKTYQGYEGVVRRYLVPGLGKKKLSTLKAPEVRAFFTRLEHDCRCCADGIDARRPIDEQECCALGQCCDKRLSVRTIQFIHAVLRNALQQAMREELVMRNVATLVQVKTPKYRVNRSLPVEDSKALLREAESDRLYVLALYLGLRRAELLGLRWEDVDLDEGTLEVEQTLQRVKGELAFVPAKTEGSERTVPLPGVCVRALRASGSAGSGARRVRGLGRLRFGVHEHGRNADRAGQPSTKLVCAATEDRAPGDTVPRPAALMRDSAAGSEGASARGPKDRGSLGRQRDHEHLCARLARRAAGGTGSAEGSA